MFLQYTDYSRHIFKQLYLSSSHPHQRKYTENFVSHFRLLSAVQSSHWHLKIHWNHIEQHRSGSESGWYWEMSQCERDLRKESEIAQYEPPGEQCVHEQCLQVHYNQHWGHREISTSGHSEYGLQQEQQRAIERRNKKMKPRKRETCARALLKQHDITQHLWQRCGKLNALVGSESGNLLTQTSKAISEIKYLCWSTIMGNNNWNFYFYNDPETDSSYTVK